ncbi:MAG: hypothetical protein KDI98_08155, partial [Hyphomicrobiaceae bacterium]|nr:hypothetical protein [Hyphomicrobiaceae bacterium]
RGTAGRPDGLKPLAQRDGFSFADHAGIPGKRRKGGRVVSGQGGGRPGERQCSQKRENERARSLARALPRAA